MQVESRNSSSVAIYFPYYYFLFFFHSSREEPVRNYYNGIRILPVDANYLRAFKLTDYIECKLLHVHKLISSVGQEGDVR